MLSVHTHKIFMSEPNVIFTYCNVWVWPCVTTTWFVWILHQLLNTYTLNFRQIRPPTKKMSPDQLNRLLYNVLEVHMCTNLNYTFYSANRMNPVKSHQQLYTSGSICRRLKAVHSTHKSTFLKTSGRLQNRFEWAPWNYAKRLEKSKICYVHVWVYSFIS